MVSCDVNCKGACAVKEETILTLSGLTKPDSAHPGDTINIGCTINSSGLGTALVCLYDTISGNCLDSTTITMYPWSSNPVSWSIPMIQQDYHLNISAVDVGSLGGLYCNDFINFTVTAIAPAGQGYTCNSSTRTCFPDSTSTTTYAQCTYACSGGTSGQCPNPAAQMLYPLCIDKNWLIIGGALAFAFMILSRR